MKWLDPIEELYNLYLEKEDSSKIVELIDDGTVMNQPDPIEELYDMYLEEEDTLRIVEVAVDDLDLESDIENGLADLYLEL